MKCAFIICAFVAVASVGFGAGPYAVLPFAATGVDSMTAQVASGLLLSELRAEGVSVHDRRDISPTESPEEATSYLTGSGAEFAVYGSLLQLGNKILVEVNVAEVATAEITFTDRLSSETTEDLDTVIRRLARGIATGKKADATATVGTVTAAEARAPRRRTSFSSIGLRAGYMWPTSDSWAGVTKMVAVDLVYRYETPKWELEVIPLLGIRGGSTDGNSAGDWAILDFSFHYFLTPTDISPYLGGGLGFHSVAAEEDGHDDSETGFAINAGGGVMFFRTYDFRLTADLRYQYVTYTFKDIEHDQTQSFMFTIGFAYARGRHR